MRKLLTIILLIVSINISSQNINVEKYKNCRQLKSFIKKNFNDLNIYDDIGDGRYIFVPRNKKIYKLYFSKKRYKYISDSAKVVFEKFILEKKCKNINIIKD